VLADTVRAHTAHALQKAARAKKDPNAPKRGQSGYMIWLNESRKSLTKPGMSVTDVAKAAGVEWGKLKDKSVRFTVVHRVCA